MKSIIADLASPFSLFEAFVHWTFEISSNGTYSHTQKCFWLGVFSTVGGVLSIMGVVKWVGHAHSQVGQSTVHTSRQTYFILSFFAQGVQILEDFEVLSMIFWPIYIVRKMLKISKSSKIWIPWGKMLKMKYVCLEVCIVHWPTWLWAWPTHKVTPMVESIPLTVLIYLVIKNTFKHDCR